MDNGEIVESPGGGFGRPEHRNVVVAAIAREMLAYIWAISREVVLVPVDPKARLSRVPA